VRVTTLRVESSAASAQTLKRGGGVVREMVSKGASHDQLKHELKTLTKEERDDLLDSAVGQSPLVIQADEVLAMKADLSITWSKLRHLRRNDHLHIIYRLLCPKTGEWELGRSN
jgi:hypothetical protein